MLPQLVRLFAARKTPWKIVTGDFVEVIAGRDKRKQGTVTEVLRKTNQVIVSGVNIKTKHLGASAENPQGRVEHKEFPVHISNVALIDPETERPCRVKFAYLEDGSRVRIAVKTGSLLPKPEREDTSYASRNHNKTDGLKDTPADVALEQTYFGEDYAAIEQQFSEYIRERERQAAWLVFKE